jgi:glutamate racemase
LSERRETWEELLELVENANSRPVIGVFDSGFGGLTVLRALVKGMPEARFAFLGDTARLPYGSKSRRTIARYAAESAQFLVREQSAELLVIACNTASALALDAIQDAVDVPVLGVIEPGAAAAANSATRDVLVIATEATVASHAYAAACRAQGLRAVEKACPLLVPLVEEGWTDHPVTAEVVRYPLLRTVFEAAVPEGMRIIDSAEATAEAAARLVAAQAKYPAQASKPRPGAPLVPGTPEIRCFATDSVEKFERLGSRFLGLPVGKVELVDLGG